MILRSLLIEATPYLTTHQTYKLAHITHEAIAHHTLWHAFTAALLMSHIITHVTYEFYYSCHIWIYYSSHHTLWHASTAGLLMSRMKSLLISLLMSLIHMCDMTHSCVWHGSFLRDMTHYTCDMTHSYVWHNSFMCVTWLIPTWHDSIFVWHDPFICVT